MSFSKEFERELDEMFSYRTNELRNLFKQNKTSKNLRITRTFVTEKITTLNEIATDKFIDQLYREEYNSDIKKKKCWKVNGRGYKEKKEYFKAWFNKHFSNHQRLIYIFWGKNGSAVYVGRTGIGGSRPTHHFIKVWFQKVKSVHVFAASSIKQINKLECLAIHRYRPTENLKKSSSGYRSQVCPVCRIHLNIEKEIRHIFSIRR